MPKDEQIKETMALVHWPPWPVEVPPVLVERVALTDEGFLEFSPPRRSRPQSMDDLTATWAGYRPVPQELYLRELADLDLADAQAIAGFTRRYGRLGSSDWRDLPRERKRPRELRAIDALLRQHLRPGETLARRSFSHVEEVAAHARVMRDATRLWTAYRAEADLQSVIERWESALAPPINPPAISLHGRASREIPPEENLARAVGIFFPLLFDAALRPYHVRVEGRSQATPQGVPPGFPHASLFSALCLQLRNHMAENATYKRCGNETCRRLFVSKRSKGDRPAVFHRKTKVEFCCEPCMWAQNKRDSRRSSGKRPRAEGSRNGSPDKGGSNGQPE